MSSDTSDQIIKQFDSKEREAAYKSYPAFTANVGSLALCSLFFWFKILTSYTETLMFCPNTLLCLNRKYLFYRISNCGLWKADIKSWLIVLFCFLIISCRLATLGQTGGRLWSALFVRHQWGNSVPVLRQLGCSSVLSHQRKRPETTAAALGVTHSAACRGWDQREMICVYRQ